MDEKYWFISAYNDLPEVMDKSHFPRSVKFYDTTLRDGEQTIGVNFNPDDKVMIAELLDEVGVERIEVGMPVVSRQDREAASRIVNKGLKAELWGFARCVKDDIDACLDVGLKSIVLEIATSPHKMKAYNFTPDGVMEKLLKNIQYAKGQGLYTAFFAVDATRTDIDYLRAVYTNAVNEGKADEVVIVDTLGVATPETMYYLTRKVKEWVPVPVATHCHNDFGMATACSLASVKAGAEYIHVTANGLGEKTGNTDLAEAAIAAKAYNLDMGVDLKKLRRLSKNVEKISRVPLSYLKPVVGENVFKRESGVAVAQLVKYPPAVEGYAPEVVGGEREILLSKKSGKASIEWMLQKNNLKATPGQIDAILAQVKERGIQNRGIVPETEFLEIAKRSIAAV